MDKQKILIVDDEPLVVLQLVGFLSDEPYDVFTAKNGIAGLEILRKEKIDLAVVEIQVEDIDGITLLNRVKAEKIQTAILIMTGLRSAELGCAASSMKKSCPQKIALRSNTHSHLYRSSP